MGDLHSQETVTPPFNLQEAIATSQPTQVCRGVVIGRALRLTPGLLARVSMEDYRTTRL